ncbi:hypothetical protein BJ508DRAFT_331759 [Ascobolus immersus RN42]|uniref:Uncharacterized protein n=1 Tax=Ascobolus immersus RN42 TaxID=1160509 RepID=A0A3N4HS83_ASCIM|nr:hypothetical protein BJ508DRAFT_331759 [Ascobolus immersus RN42]
MLEITVKIHDRYSEAIRTLTARASSQVDKLPFLIKFHSGNSRLFVSFPFPPSGRRLGISNLKELLMTVNHKIVNEKGAYPYSPQLLKEELKLRTCIDIIALPSVYEEKARRLWLAALIIIKLLAIAGTLIFAHRIMAITKKYEDLFGLTTLTAVMVSACVISISSIGLFDAVKEILEDSFDGLDIIGVDQAVGSSQAGYVEERK